MFKKELDILLTAILFYTRIPISQSIKFSSDLFNKATRYLPLIGWIVGGFGALIFVLFNNYISQNISIIIALVFMILLTGAFHEDAFADFCDGFGGGYTKEKILSIMKDSCIGTYGAVGITLLLLTKYVLLTNIPATYIPFVLIAAHTLSRLMTVYLIYSSKYTGNIQNSKSKAVDGTKSIKTLIIASLFGLIPLFFFGLYTISFIIIIQFLVFLMFRFYIHKKINGYTGDVLGALQQISEVVFYLSYIIILSTL